MNVLYYSRLEHSDWVIGQKDLVSRCSNRVVICGLEIDYLSCVVLIRYVDLWLLRLCGLEKMGEM